MNTSFYRATIKIGPVLAITIASLTLISGCAVVSRPVPVAPGQCWTDHVQSEDRIRFYSNVSESQVLRAAERLLQLAGSKDDMLIRHSKEGITAEYHRERLFYAYLFAHQSSVWDHWIVTTRPEAAGTHICVHVRGQYYSETFILGADPVTNAVYPANATERDPGKNFKPRAQAYPIDFDTFWARLEYLIGIKPTWASCPSGGFGGIVKNKTRGREEVNPLCRSLVNDPSPPITVEP